MRENSELGEPRRYLVGRVVNGGINAWLDRWVVSGPGKARPWWVCWKGGAKRYSEAGARRAKAILETRGRKDVFIYPLPCAAEARRQEGGL
jgi:hypothetical protein